MKVFSNASLILVAAFALTVGCKSRSYNDSGDGKVKFIGGGDLDIGLGDVVEAIKETSKPEAMIFTVQQEGSSETVCIYSAPLIDAESKNKVINASLAEAISPSPVKIEDVKNNVKEIQDRLKAKAQSANDKAWDSLVTDLKGDFNFLNGKGENEPKPGVGMRILNTIGFLYLAPGEILGSEFLALHISRLGTNYQISQLDKSVKDGKGYQFPKNQWNGAKSRALAAAVRVASRKARKEGSTETCDVARDTANF